MHGAPSAGAVSGAALGLSDPGICTEGARHDGQPLYREAAASELVMGPGPGLFVLTGEKLGLQPGSSS